MNRVRSRLLDIRDAIQNIEAEAVNGREAFDNDPKVQVWMVHYIRIIGEAARVVSDDLKALDPALPTHVKIGVGIDSTN